MSERLRLRAEDAEDLAVLAAVLQDARLPVGEMVFQQGEARFLAAFGRYRRELLGDPTRCEGIDQIRSVLTVEGVEAAKVRGLETLEGDPLELELSLLTLLATPGDNDRVHITLIFAGDIAVQLRARDIACRLEDFGEAWQPFVTPCDHFADDARTRKLEEGRPDAGPA
jgi:hypothetical protein